MRTTTIAIGAAFAVAAWLAASGGVLAQTARTDTRAGVQPVATDLSAQRRETRPPRRLRIYRRDESYGVIPRYNPGPNAKRECTATYVQEFRPSGTVIVPRMNCFWRPG